MRLNASTVLTLLALVAAGLAGWWWSQNMERAWRAMPYQSEAAGADPMLAAARFLRGEGRTVASHDNLDIALRQPLDAGALLIANNANVMTPEQADRLLRWVATGGVLINTADSGIEDGDDEDPDEIAPLSYRFRTWLEFRREKNAEPVPVRLPGTAYPLLIDRGPAWLKAEKDAPVATGGDAAGEFVRVYRHGAGHLVLLSAMPFDNDNLRRRDHAELLRTLVRLGPAKPVWIVQGLDMPPWYEALWHRFPLGIVALGLALAILLWSALPRFGPLLPPPASERRALLEHIDASARWLWRAKGGRDVLLGALRRNVIARLGRRSPELARLSPAELAYRLAHRHQLPQRQLEQALLQPAAAQPAEFVRQIQTLQLLRSRHER